MLRICSREEEKNKGGDGTTQIEIQACGVKDGLTGLVCDLEKGLNVLGWQRSITFQWPSGPFSLVR